jgi:uncharacterized protein (DUF1800 family)
MMFIKNAARLACASTRLARMGVTALAIASISACSGSSGNNGGAESEPKAAEGSSALSAAPSVYNGVASSTSTIAASAANIPSEKQVSQQDAARFLTQATFGITSLEEINTVRAVGYERWLDEQFALKSGSMVEYVAQQASRTDDGKPREEMAYEGLWQQWLYTPAQLRARTVWALSQIMVVSNVSPELNAPALASYVDTLNDNAFGNYRQLLESVTLHPAMGYYLNMMESEKENPDKGTHPNENYAREVLQLFSIGLVQLGPDGTPLKDDQGKTIPTFDEDTVKGFAKAFSGWSFGGRDTAKNDDFYHGPENWTIPMQAWASKHSTATKKLLNGVVLPAGQTPQQDMQQALDNIFNHPNVGPFLARRLIQRLVTSNPSPAYLGRVAAVFNNNAAGVRGDLKAVIKAILLDPEARDLAAVQSTSAGKLREPVIRFANLLRITNARSENGTNRIHYLDSPDFGLGQSPLLSPSVFNFYSPDFRASGEITRAGLSSPEFQITTEMTMVGSLNFLNRVISEAGYGDKDSRINLSYSRLAEKAADANALIDQINLLLFQGAMTPATRTSFLRVINGIDPKNIDDRVKAALLLTMISPEYTIQK